MPAPRKYPDELRERAIRLVLDIEEETGNITAACRRIGEELARDCIGNLRQRDAGADTACMTDPTCANVGGRGSVRERSLPDKINLTADGCTAVPRPRSRCSPPPHATAR